MKYHRDSFYFVAAATKNGSAPGLNKACDGKVFLDQQEADKYCKKISEQVGYKYRVFVSEAITPVLQRCVKLAKELK